MSLYPRKPPNCCYISFNPHTPSSGSSAVWLPPRSLPWKVPSPEPGVLTNDRKAAIKRMRTRRSSNCSSTNSQRDFPGGKTQSKAQSVLRKTPVPADRGFRPLRPLRPTGPRPLLAAELLQWALVDIQCCHGGVFSLILNTVISGIGLVVLRLFVTTRPNPLCFSSQLVAVPPHQSSAVSAACSAIKRLPPPQPQHPPPNLKARAHPHLQPMTYLLLQGALCVFTDSPASVPK